jgi:TP901 family phage tail tape measure protein
MAKNPFSGSIDVSSLVQILQEVTNGTKSVASAEEELQKAYKKTVAEVKKLEKAQKELNDTRNINAQLSELKSSLNQIQDALKKVGTNSTGTTKGFKSMEDALKSINVSLDGFKEKSSNITSAGNKVTQYTNGMNQLVTVTQKGSGATATYSAKVKTLNTQVQQSTKHIKNAAFATENWSYNWAKAMQSFLTYNTVTQLFNTIMNSIHDMIDQVKELDDALVELKKVTDLEGASLERFVDDAYAAGHTVAKTGTEMIEAATAFAKAGYKDEALELGTVAAMYTNIADEAIDAADAADMIIAQMKAFNITADDSMHIIDAINEVSNNFAVSSADISRNLGKASAVMANAGNSMEQYIGLMTAATEVTRNASKAANGLKTLTLRLQGMNEEGEKDLEVQAQMEGLFNKLGISVYKSNGELKNTYEILETLAPIYKELTNAEKAYVTETIAGKYQAQNAAAILNNWTTAVNATETAMNSAGSAARENEKVLNSIQGHLQRLNSAWEELSRNLFDSKFIKFAIDLAKAFIDVANSGAGQAVIKLMTLVTIFKLLHAGGLKLVSGLTKIGSNFKNNVLLLRQYNVVSKQAKTTTNALTTAEQAKILVDGKALISQLALNAAIAAVSIGIMIASSAYENYKKRIEEAREKLHESYEEYKNINEKVTEYDTKVKELRKTMESSNRSSEDYTKAQEELKTIQDELVKTYPDWKDKIDLVNGSLDDQLKYLQEINKEEARKVLREGAKGKQDSETKLGLTGENEWYIEQDGSFEAEHIEQAIFVQKYYLETTEKNIKKLKGLLSELSNLDRDFMIDGDKILLYGDNVYDIVNYYEQLSKKIQESYSELGLSKKEADELITKISSEVSKIKSDYNYDENMKALKEYAQAYLAQSEEYEEFLKEIKEKGDKGLLTSDDINSALKGFSDDPESDFYEPRFEEISKWLKILGYDAESLANEFNKPENKLKSFFEEIDTQRLEEYNNKLKETGENLNNKNNTNYWAEVLDEYNNFWKEISQLEDKSEENVEEHLRKYSKLKGIMDENGESVEDLIRDMDDYNTLGSHFYNINDLQDMSEEAENSLDTINDEYKDVIDTLEEYGFTIEDVTNTQATAISIFDKTVPSLADLSTQFKNLKTDLDNLSSGYSTLSTAMDEYNSNGYLTIDTLEKVLSLEDGWINSLDIQNGQMSINEQSIRNILDARLNDADALAIQTAYSQLKEIADKGEAGAVEYLKTKYGDLKTQLDNTALSYDEVANAAARYKAVEGISDSEITAIDDVMDALDKRLKMTADFRKKASQNFGGSMGRSSKSSGGSSGSSKEWWEKELDNLKDQYDNSEITINEYINSLQNLLGKVGQGTEAWRKINKELQKQKLDKIKDDYNAGRISLNQYIISLQNLQKEYKQSTKEWNNLADAIKKAKLDQLKKQQDDLKSALSAVNDVLDKQIDEYKDLKDAADDRYDDELDKLNDLKDSLDDKNDDYERAQKAVVDFLNEQLDAINEQKDTVENYYDDVIDAIEKMNEDTKESIELAEAYEALMNAMTQKTKKVYKEGLGWVWTTDAEAIKEAKKTYDDLINSATTKEIEEQKDKTVKSLEEQIESLQNYIDSWDKVFDKFDNEKNRNLADILLGENWSEMVSNLDPQIVDDFSDAYYELQKNLEETEKQIEELNKQKEEEDEYWDKLIKDLQDYKGEWDDIASVYEEAQNALKAKQIIGANWEKEILDRRLDVLENFKNKYNAILAEIDKVDNMSTDQASGYTALRLPGYANGGEVDYTGLAVLHGTPNKPEYVLNNSQMRNLLGNLTKPRTTSIINNKSGAVVNNYNFGDIELPNVTNAQQFANELKSMLNITKNQ